MNWAESEAEQCTAVAPNLSPAPRCGLVDDGHYAHQSEDGVMWVGHWADGMSRADLVDEVESLRRRLR